MTTALNTAFPSWVIDAIARGHVEAITAAPAPADDTAPAPVAVAESTIEATAPDTTTAPAKAPKRAKKGARGQSRIAKSNVNADMLLPCDIPEIETHALTGSLDVVGLDD